MSWLESKLVWVLGAIVALVSIYALGRKDGKYTAEQKEKEQILENVKKVRNIDMLGHDDLVRVRDKHE